METTLHHYSHDISKPAGAEAYRELRKKLKAAGYLSRWMNAYADTKGADKDHNGSEKVSLETKFLFSNQWNEEADEARKGRRLFDWYEGIYPNKDIKAGHWLEITPEMAAIRESTKTCGYCGAHHHSDAEFCDKCTGSEYLTPGLLHLLRLRPVAEHYPQRAVLTEEEAAVLVPEYNEAQGLGIVSREVAAKAKTRQRVAGLVPEAQAKAAQAVRDAEIETEAYTWLLDHGVDILDNVLFYTHTQRFGFGWRTKLTPTEKSELLDILVEFHFDYDIQSS